jgi:hypothetical protein
VLLDLGIQTRHDPLQAPEPLKQLCIWRLPALTRRAARTWEDAVNFAAHTVGAWLSLVAFDLQRGVKVSVYDVECVHGRRTLRLRHVTHDRGFGVGAPAECPLMLPFDLRPGSGEFSACGESSDMICARANNAGVRQFEESRKYILGRGGRLTRRGAVTHVGTYKGSDTLCYMRFSGTWPDEYPVPYVGTSAGRLSLWLVWKQDVIAVRKPFDACPPASALQCCAALS